MYKLLVLSTLLAVALASKAKCPMAFGKYPLDEKRLVGEWNVVASNAILKDGMKCTKLNYQVTNEAHIIGVTGVTKENKPIRGEIYATPYFGKEKAGLLAAVYKKEDGSYTSVMKQSIVATDYDNYAVFIACKPVFDETTKTFGRHIKAGILSRKTTLTEETLSVLKNILSGYDIEIDTIKPVEHVNC